MAGSPQAWMALWTSWLQLGPQPALAGVACAAFGAATLLPIPSEALLLATVAAWPDWAAQAWMVASLANAAGGMSTYAIGRMCAQGIDAAARGPKGLGALSRAARRATAALHQWQARLGRHGSRLTALGFLPVVGEAIVLAAGALRMPAAACWWWQLLGRAMRYALVLVPMLWFS